MEYRPLADELAAETRHVQELHRLLAAELDVVSGRSTAALSARTGGELSARWERDVAVHRWSERAAQLRGMIYLYHNLYYLGTSKNVAGIRYYADGLPRLGTAGFAAAG